MLNFGHQFLLLAIKNRGLKQDFSNGCCCLVFYAMHDLIWEVTTMELGVSCCVYLLNAAALIKLLTGISSFKPECKQELACMCKPHIS